MNVYISVTLYHYEKLDKKEDSLTCCEKNKKLMGLLKKSS